MTESSSHILIAGGGMVGLSLALLLDQALEPNARITLVEGMALTNAEGSSAAYHPSFDARSTALSYSTAQYYRELDIWTALEPGLGAIRHIHVSRQGRFGSTLLDAQERGWEAMGWVVENPCLGQALIAAVRQRPRIELRCPARVVDAQPSARGMCVALEDDQEDVDLLIVADGAESALRTKLGFFTQRKRYGQHALVANVGFESEHGNRAFERFTTSGPLALLPLPSSSESRHRMALVWSLDPERAETLKEADEHTFAAALLEEFGHRLGRVSRVGDRQCYPLTLTEAKEQARRACVVLGNAAHALHPVAGQGFNLALRDAAVLASLVAEALKTGCHPGSPEVLSDYLQKRQRDQSQTIAASDALPSLFMSRDPLLSMARDLALSGLDLLPGLQREFIKQAAGMSALESPRV